MLTDQELMELHVRALFTHDANSRLLLVNEPGSEASAPRLFLGRTPDGNIWRLRAGLPDDLAAELDRLCAAEPTSLDHEPRQLPTLMRLLENHAPVRKVGQGPAYAFVTYADPDATLIEITEADEEKLRGGFEEMIPELPTYQPFVALLAGNRAVSICRSVRITSAAHEAGVETLPEFRGRGHAKKVVAGWARLVRSLGAIPLYSTSWENKASQAVATNLNLALYGTDFHIT